MSYSGPCFWIKQLSAFCDPAMKWKDARDMHRRCAGTFIARNPPPSGVGRVYGKCQCKCHRQALPPPMHHKERVHKVQAQDEKHAAIRAPYGSKNSLGTTHKISTLVRSTSPRFKHQTQLQTESIDSRRKDSSRDRQRSLPFRKEKKKCKE